MSDTAGYNFAKLGVPFRVSQCRQAATTAHWRQFMFKEHFRFFSFLFNMFAKLLRLV